MAGDPLKQQEFDGLPVVPHRVLADLADYFKLSPSDVEGIFQAAYKRHHESYQGTFQNDAAAKRINGELAEFQRSKTLPYYVLAEHADIANN